MSGCDCMLCCAGVGCPAALVRERSDNPQVVVRPGRVRWPVEPAEPLPMTSAQRFRLLAGAVDVGIVEACVADIAAQAGDDETAHGIEDELHAGVLLAIADGRCEDPAACARAAMRTADLDFGRWCA